ncbi:hypothetical protein [Clostridium thermarum]|nr:hypothetical protein [Clostridium thermarum]
MLSKKIIRSVMVGLVITLALGVSAGVRLCAFEDPDPMSRIVLIIK